MAKGSGTTRTVGSGAAATTRANGGATGMTFANTVNFTTSRGHQMTIENNTVTVVDRFGDIYRCKIDEKGKLVARSSVALGVCMRAMDEYRATLARR